MEKGDVHESCPTMHLTYESGPEGLMIACRKLKMGPVHLYSLDSCNRTLRLYKVHLEIGANLQSRNARMLEQVEYIGLTLSSPASNELKHRRLGVSVPCVRILALCRVPKQSRHWFHFVASHLP